MAEKIFIKGHQWGTIFANVLNRGKTLQDEALHFGTDKDTLIKMGNEKFSHSPEWENCKRVSAQREKKQVLKKTFSSQMNALAPTSAPSPTSAPTPALREKEKLQKRVASCASSLEAAEAILAVRKEALTDARSVLEKVQLAVENAEADEAEANAAVQRAEEQQATVQAELQQVEEKIQKVKEKTIYLVDPWFKGVLPEYGTFISTVEMEYLPEVTLAGVLLFDYVPDYKKARLFAGLVAKFELEENPYHLLVSDERVKELLKMYI